MSEWEPGQRFEVRSRQRKFWIRDRVNREWYSDPETGVIVLFSPWLRHKADEFVRELNKKDLEERN